MSIQKYTLEIAIPTFNRTLFLQKCLDSILIAINNLSLKEKRKVGISISDNSTKDKKNRSELLSFYKNKFKISKIGYFNYRISGSNIGSPQNILFLLSKSNSDYTWLLPDDDVARFDSIKSILDSIKKYKPCFLIGGWINKSKIDHFNDQIKFDDFR